MPVRARPGCPRQATIEKPARSSAGCVGFEPHRSEVLSRGQVHLGVQGGGQTLQQRDGGLGAAFFDALDLIGGHASPPGPG